MQKCRRRPLLTWFKLRPAELAPLLAKDDAELGKDMRRMLLNLMANQGAPGTPEGAMLAEAREASERWAAAARARWAKRGGSEVADDMGPVYEAAAEMGVDDVDAAEWHHAQRGKGFSQLENWPGAMKRWTERRKEGT